MNAWRTLRALLLLAALSGCVKAPFTTSVLEHYGLSSADLGRVQFYTSEKIVLAREVTRQAREQRGAELRLHDETETEIVEISEYTPCVVLRAEGDYLLLGFSPNDRSAALWFEAEPADETAGDERRYLLAALDNGYDEPPPFTPRFAKGFLISWAGNKYHVVSGRAAYLLYQMSDDERRKTEVSPPGWRLSDRAERRGVLASPPSAAETDSPPAPPLSAADVEPAPGQPPSAAGVESAPGQPPSTAAVEPAPNAESAPGTLPSTNKPEQAP